MEGRKEGRKGGSNYPLKGYKGTLWEGGTRSAAFVHAPNILSQSGTINHKYMISN